MIVRFIKYTSKDDARIYSQAKTLIDAKNIDIILLFKIFFCFKIKCFVKFNFQIKQNVNVYVTHTITKSITHYTDFDYVDIGERDDDKMIHGHSYLSNNFNRFYFVLCVSIHNTS